MASARREFRYSDLLPHDEPVSKWLLAVLASADDAARATGRFEHWGTCSGSGPSCARAQAEMCYYLRLMVGHTAEGFDHVVLQAKDRGKGLYQGAQRQEIQKWVKQDPHLKCLQGEVQQSKATHGTLLKAFRHATFHCLVQYYPGILREMKDVVTSLPNSESVSPSDRPFAELVALPQMHAVHRKCADILEGKKRKKGEPPCVDQWLSDVAADVMGMCGLLQKFALFAARRRAGEKGIGLADAMS